ncbi:peptidoglycan DD-metalloendopeptidase family protein [Virgibacillus dakarensis]|nr:peptidoglycan DD-metalloendopeptidase family protein [Virgibacillus dakarensis]
MQLILFQLVLPALFIVSLFVSKFKGRLDWVLQALFFTVYISWVFFSGRWDWTGYYIRFLWPLLLIFALYMSWQRVRSLPSGQTYTGKEKGAFVFYSLLILVFGLYHVQIFTGYTTDEEAVELEFPLKDGTFYVGHGGASTSVNAHYAHPEQRFALDIVQLNNLGVRTAGIYPEELDRYVIYGAEVSSPCTGEIVKARNNMPDLTPPESNPDKPEGNYVQVSCEKTEANVIIAHLQEGSVTVQAGDQIETGQFVGLVGNSGNTSEPHLHIHAERDGQGVPIEFDGRFLLRNSLVWE